MIELKIINTSLTFESGFPPLREMENKKKWLLFQDLPVFDMFAPLGV